MAQFQGILSSKPIGDEHRLKLSEIGHKLPADAHSCGGENFALSAPLALESDDRLIGLSGDPIWNGKPVLSEDPQAALQSIGECWSRKGRDCLENLAGAFALVVLEPRRNRAFLAVDRLGIERLVYASGNGSIFFSDDAGSVADLSGFGRQINRQAVFNYLFMHMVPAPDTIYEKVSKLPLASFIEWDGESIERGIYWRPTDPPPGTPRRDELEAALHEAMETGLENSRLSDTTGAFLSGGLDSSAVAGKLSALHPEQAPTFTVGFGEADFDELKYSRAAVRHFGCKAYEYAMSPGDITRAFPLIAESYDEPFGNSSAAPTYFCAKLAAENGIDHLLAGDGGDELFGGNERYVRQAVFELYGRIPGLLRRSVVEPLAGLISPDSPVMPLRKFRSYVDQATIPLPERFESWNFMYRDGGADMLVPAFRESIDERGPLALMEQAWEDNRSRTQLDQMLRYDWRFTLADNDLRKVTTMSRAAGIRVSYPLLDMAVVDVSVRVPADWKIRGTRLRDFYKRAMQSYLPDEIINKPKHGFGLPFGLWLKTDKDLGDLVYGHLDALKSRNIVQHDVIDDLISSHREGHPSYFGYAIWDLAMLEAWLATHVGSFRA